MGRDVSTIVTDASDFDRALAAANRALVVIVYLDDDRLKRRVFLTLKSAERHAQRARDRGHEASVIVAELRPAFTLPAVVDGGEAS